jgi:uncharacterized membrane protein
MESFVDLEYVFYQIYRYTIGLFDGGDSENNVISVVMSQDWYAAISLIKNVLSFVILFLIVAVMYVVVRLRELNAEEAAQFTFAEPEHGHGEIKNERWELIEEHVSSNNPSDWRVAILEADNMLEDMLVRMGYDGDSIADRLRAVEPSDFTHIQSAWEAHKVRNQIAHEGVNFVVTEREARRVIELYRKVFEEFRYI